MEIIRKISQIDPGDVKVLERLFGQRLEASAEIVLRTREMAETPALSSDDDELPAWLNVLEGFSDEELAEFDALIAKRVRIGPSMD